MYIFVLMLASLSKPLPEEQPQTELLLICIIRSILMRNVEDIIKKGLLRMNVHVL